MNLTVRLIAGLYSVLLRLYPASFRSEFEKEMRAVFAGALEEASQRGLRSVAALAFREARDWPVSLMREAWFDFRHRRGTVKRTQNHPLAAWTSIGLVILPGLLVFANSWVVSARNTVPALGLALCAILSIAGLIRAHRLPLWSYTTLGLTLGLFAQPFWPVGILLAPLAIVAIVRWFQRRNTKLPRSTWTLIGLMIVTGLARPAVLSLFPNRHAYIDLWDLAGDGALLTVIALGLLLTRRSGIVACLFVLAAGFVLFEEVLDLTYGLWKTPWGIVMVAMLASLLLVVVPCWVMRARTDRWQRVAVLAPTAVALSCAVAINALVRTQPSSLDSVLDLTALVPATSPPWIGVGVGGPAELWPLLIGGSLTAAQLFLGVMLATLLYGRLGRQAAPASEKPDQAKPSVPFWLVAPRVWR